MQIDLKDPNTLTLQAVRDLLASKDDTAHRQLRVTKEGIAYLSDEVGLDNIDDLACRLETWSAGAGYCGSAAASDEEWVRTVFKDLRDNWPSPKGTYIDS